MQTTTSSLVILRSFAHEPVPVSKQFILETIMSTDNNAEVKELRDKIRKLCHRVQQVKSDAERDSESLNGRINELQQSNEKLAATIDDNNEKTKGRCGYVRESQQYLNRRVLDMEYTKFPSFF